MLMPPDGHGLQEDIRNAVKNGHMDDFALFVPGYPFYVEGLKVSEQTSPYYSVLVGREFGRPVCVVEAEYPQSVPGTPGSHDEAYVRISSYDRKYFGFWLDRDVFINDYAGKMNKPKINGADSDFVPFTI